MIDLGLASNTDTFSAIVAFETLHSTARSRTGILICNAECQKTMNFLRAVRDARVSSIKPGRKRISNELSRLPGSLALRANNDVLRPKERKKDSQWIMQGIDNL